MLGGEEGGNTIHVPSGEKLAIYDAAMRYQQEHTPLVIIAGKNTEQVLHVTGLPKERTC